VEALEKRTSLRQVVVVDPSSGLSAAQMATMLQKAMENRGEDSVCAQNISLKIESLRMIKFWKLIVDEIPLSHREVAKSAMASLENALAEDRFAEAIPLRKKIEELFAPFLDDIINSRLSGKIVDD
jgi:molecular chaperone DnaK (HSP70)